MRFSPKCAEKINVYQSMQNFYQLVKYSLINSRNWIHVMSDVRCMRKYLWPVEYQLLVKTSQTEKGWIVENW